MQKSSEMCKPWVEFAIAKNYLRQGISNEFEFSIIFFSLFSASVVRELLLTSGLNQHQLASVWNLSDINRDGCLSIDEFCIACHITRYCKTGNKILIFCTILLKNVYSVDFKGKLGRFPYMQTTTLT